MTNLNEIENQNLEILNARTKRQAEAFKNYMEQSFPTLPKKTLASLQKAIQIYETRVASDPSNNDLQAFLQALKDQVTNGDYSKEGSDDMAYHDAYNAHARNFVWPTQDELEIRSVEDLVITTSVQTYTQNS
jgi:hypothetical protein